jgi:hypothetical protein
MVLGSNRHHLTKASHPVELPPPLGEDKCSTHESLHPFSLKSRVALVTGASSGLGQQFARALADNGAAVALVARRTDRLLDLQQEIEAAGAKAIAIEADVTDRAAMARAFDAAEKAFGTVDILVNKRASRSRCATDVSANGGACSVDSRGVLLGAGSRAPHDRGQAVGRHRQHRVGAGLWRDQGHRRLCGRQGSDR